MGGKKVSSSCWQRWQASESRGRHGIFSRKELTKTTGALELTFPIDCTLRDKSLQETVYLLSAITSAPETTVCDPGLLIYLTLPHVEGYIGPSRTPGTTVLISILEVVGRQWEATLIWKATFAARQRTPWSMLRFIASFRCKSRTPFCPNGSVGPRGSFTPHLVSGESLVSMRNQIVLSLVTDAMSISLGCLLARLVSLFRRCPLAQR